MFLVSLAVLKGILLWLLFYTPESIDNTGVFYTLWQTLFRTINFPLWPASNAQLTPDLTRS